MILPLLFVSGFAMEVTPFKAKKHGRRRRLQEMRDRTNCESNKITFRHNFFAALKVHNKQTLALSTSAQQKVTLESFTLGGKKFGLIIGRLTRS